MTLRARIFSCHAYEGECSDIESAKRAAVWRVPKPITLEFLSTVLRRAIYSFLPQKYQYRAALTGFVTCNIVIILTTSLAENNCFSSSDCGTVLYLYGLD